MLYFSDFKYFTKTILLHCPAAQPGIAHTIFVEMNELIQISDVSGEAP